MEQKHCVITPILLLPLREAGGGDGGEGGTGQPPGRGGVGEGTAVKHWGSSTSIAGLGHGRPLAAADPECFEAH